MIELRVIAAVENNLIVDVPDDGDSDLAYVPAFLIQFLYLGFLVSRLRHDRA
jgi:hypothetical protein